MTFSDQQTEIFRFFAEGNGNLVVRARAGVGKTFSILEGLHFAPEQSILLCAFNKRIATELQEKVKNPYAEVRTLHSLGNSLVCSRWGRLPVDADRGFRLAERATEGGPDEMVRLVAKLAAFGKAIAARPTVEALIDVALEHDLLPDEDWVKEGWTTKRLAACAVHACDLAAVKDGTIDYDDQVWLPVRMGWLRGKYDLIVVDECQDMNATQIALALGMCKPSGRIVVVGDDRQSIYKFRGADSGVIDRLRKELNATELKLTTTYRCPRVVVERAQKLVPDYQAAPDAPTGMLASCDFEKLADHVRAGDFVLSRKNAPLVRVCLSLLREGKRARIEGKDIGKGLLSLLKKIKGNSVEDFVERLEIWEEREARRLGATGKRSAEAAIETIHDKAAMLRNMTEGAASMAEVQKRVADLFEDRGAPAVVCSSVHRAKGSEADRVFLLEETLYPRGKRDDVEERNIEYVAVTRAKRELWSVTGIS